jgi:cytochrome P450
MTPPRSDIDLFADETLYDPYPAYAQLRELGPAVYLTMADAWAIPRYDEVKAALGDWELHASHNGVALNPQMNEMLKTSIICSVGEAHKVMRAPLAGAMSPRALRVLEPGVRERADKLVDQLVARGKFDAIGDLAEPFPVGVIMDMIGFPGDQRDRILQWADAGFQATGPANGRCLAGFPLLQEMFEYLVTLTEDDFEPGQMGRAMFEASRRGELDGDVIPLLWNFTGPAMDTTISAIGHAIWRFAQQPEQWTLVREDRSLIPSAMLEALRMDAPIQLFSRELSEDAVIGDVEVPASARTIMMYGSANRDHRHYPDPDRFDVRRNPVDHLAFGYGLHGCVGQGLARLEVSNVLSALADRVTRFTVDDPEQLARPPRHLNNLIRSIDSLPVTVEAA